MTPTLQERIALRLKARRDSLHLTQQDLAGRLGFKDRQTLSAIEQGERRISTDELARAAQVLDVDVEYFTDAFRLEGEGEFSFRAKNVDPDVLGAFQARAGRWVATYRELSAQAGITPPFMGHKLQLTQSSSFEAACEAGEELRRAWNLGDVPSATLEGAIKRELAALVLYVDAPEGVSGAASNLPRLNSILINRHEAPGRRAYDLAHELFHLLTWDAMPPKPVEDPDSTHGQRVEQLAENFAGALLMPIEVVSRRWKTRGDVDLHDWLNQTATFLGVSSRALKWRVLSLGLITKTQVEALDLERLMLNGGLLPNTSPPPLFNDDFVRRIHTAVEAGRLSVRRAARILDLKQSEFAKLCRQYGLPLSYESQA